MFGYNSISAILRAMGDSTRPMVFVVIASVMNIVLDYILVAIYHMGAAGAAIATVISQATSYFISIAYLKKIHFLVPYKRCNFCIKKDVCIS